MGRLLFFKILALVVLTSVISVAAIGVYIDYVVRDNRARFLREQIGGYVSMIVDAVGTPPDTAIARSVAREHPLEMRLEGPHGFVWNSAPAIASAAMLSAETLPHDSIPASSHWSALGTYRGDHYAMRSVDGWTYIVRMNAPPGAGISAAATLLLLGVLLLLLVVAYVSIQRFLRPLKPLMKGVEEVGGGNFDYRVEIISSDELGELSRSFNRMARQINDIIASKRRLLFDVSHELRSPLTRMNVALAMLPEGKAKSSIERNVRELNVMITELLENERLAVLGGNLVVEDFDVVELARQVIDSFGNDTRRIAFDSLTETLVVTADVQRMTVALRNLISNALKYSAESAEPVRVTVYPDDEGARIMVEDKGIGIPPEAQERVFDPFYRTDESRTRATGGYGLGLSLTKSIVEAHGGTIRLNSTPGTGTTVMIWFPRTPDPAAVARPMDRVASSSERAPV